MTSRASLGRFLRRVARKMRHVLTIIREGSSADRQADHFRLCRLNGDSREEAMRSVVDMVLAETREGVL